jgi:hypothetical protein
MAAMAASPPVSPRALLLVGGAGVVCGLVHVPLALGSDRVDDRRVTAALGLLVGWSFIGTGLFAWWRRPGNHTGVLMAAAGFAWVATGSSAANSHAVFTIGVALDGVSRRSPVSETVGDDRRWGRERGDLWHGTSVIGDRK